MKLINNSRPLRK